MASAGQIAEFKAANAALVAKVETSLDTFWSYVDLSNPERARNALLNYVPLLVQQFGDLAATIAADWFEELRVDAIEAGTVGRTATSTAHSFTALPAKTVEASVIEAGVRYVAEDLFTDTPERTLDRVKHSTAYYVQQQGRDTIRENAFRRGSGSSGWKRVARSGACKFCRALADRGAVYKQSTVRFAAHAPTCNCAAVPVFDPHAPEVDVEVYRASSAVSNPAAIAAWLERKFPDEPDDHGHDH